MKAVLATGAGRYADPWHPFPATSGILARMLEDAGFDAVIDDDVDGAMTRLGDVDLLVVNAGDPWRSGSSQGPAPSASVEGFAAALRRGIGILALHSAVATLRDYPEWALAIGAVWLPGLSMHPDAGFTRIHGVANPEVDAVPDFEIFDERYCRLQFLGRRSVAATHEPAAPGSPREPTAWTRHHGASRIAVDVLGHDERSFDSDGHRALLMRLAKWAAER